MQCFITANVLPRENWRRESAWEKGVCLLLACSLAVAMLDAGCCRYITVEELERLPSYMRSRLTLDKVSD